MWSALFPAKKLTAGHAFCILWYICTYSTAMGNCICSNVRHGKTSNLTNGIHR